MSLQCRSTWGSKIWPDKEFGKGKKMTGGRYRYSPKFHRHRGLIESLCMNGDDVTKVVGVTTLDIVRSLWSSEAAMIGVRGWASSATFDVLINEHKNKGARSARAHSDANSY